VAAIRAPAPIDPAGSPQAEAAAANAASTSATSRVRDGQHGDDPARGRLVDIDA
jgi:hypothetical protein